MIQVLNHGSKYNERVCPECSCRFKYEDSDIKEKTVFWYGSDDDKEKTIYYTRFIIKCPECNYEIVTEDKIYDKSNINNEEEGIS